RYISCLKSSANAKMNHLKKAFQFLIPIAITSFAICTSSALAQQATLTDDAYTSPISAVQAANLNGKGPLIVVAGANATVLGAKVGPATGYIKFDISQTLPSGITANQIVKATLKLYSPQSNGSGSFDVFRVIDHNSASAWEEGTINNNIARALTLAPTTEASVSVADQNAFVVVDLTQLVKDWVKGPTDGGIYNNGVALVATANNSYLLFDSKESPLTGHEPTLEIILADLGTQGSSGGGTVRSVSASGPLTVTNATTTPSISLTGVIPIANGGTGPNAPGAPGSFLKSNGSGWTSAALTSADIPAGAAGYIQNGSVQQAASSFNISGDGVVGGALAGAIVNATSHFSLGGSRIMSRAPR